MLPTLKDTFVLACQISQVFYATDNNSKGWLVVRKIQPHDLHAMSLHRGWGWESRPCKWSYQNDESFHQNFDVEFVLATAIW